MIEKHQIRVGVKSVYTDRRGRAHAEAEDKERGLTVKKSTDKIEIFRCKATAGSRREGECWWHLVARGGKIIADSGEGYAGQWEAWRAARSFRRRLARPTKIVSLITGEVVW